MLIRQTLLYLPAQFLAPAAQFVSMLVWTWWLAPAEMSAFVLISASQEFAYLFAVSWFSTYALRFMPGAGDHDGRRRYLGTETTLMLLTALPQMGAAALAAHLVDGGWSPTAIAVIAAYFVTRGLNQHYAERARAQSTILAYTILQTAGPIGGLVVGLVVVETMGATALDLLGAYAVAQAVGTVLALPLIGVSLRPRAVDRAILSTALAYGGPMLGLNLLSWFAENNVRYVVEHTAGAVAFGLMAVGWGIGRRCASVAAMLVAAAAFPLASRMMNEGDRGAALHQLRVNAALLLGVLVPTVVGLAMVGGLLTDLAVAEAYRETTKDVLTLATLGGALRFLHLHTSDQLFVLERRFAYAAWVDVVEIIGMVVLATAGLVGWGLVGAVAGTAVASALAAACSAYLAIRRLGFSFPLGDFAKITLATATMAAGLALTPYPATAFGLTVAVAAGGLVYTLTMALLYAPVLAPIARRKLATA